MTGTDMPLWIWGDDGLPPLDRACPASIERDLRAAIAIRRDEIRKIASDPALPDFANTIAALELGGRELRRVRAVFRTLSTTSADAEMREAEQRLAPLEAALDDAIAHDATLFARVDAVHAQADALGLDAGQRRLTAVLRQQMLRRGAALSGAARERLAEINGRVAGLQARFNQNLLAEQDGQFVYAGDEAELRGLDAGFQTAAALLAAGRGRQGGWAIANTRPAVMAVLTDAEDRGLRQRVWRMWTMRGDNAGPNDNKPVIAEILQLRGEKARLLGFADFAQFAMADRMAGTPEVALALLGRVWERVLPVTRAHLEELQQLADADGLDGPIAAWDRYYYAERLRRERFGLDAGAVRPYLQLPLVLDAIFAAADRLHGLQFVHRPDAPVHHPDVTAYEVGCNGKAIGLLYLDLIARPGKQRGSWQSELRAAEPAAEVGAARAVPVSLVVSSLDRSTDGGPILIGWEYANVLFHEAGHALHMLLAAPRWPLLGSMAVAWDMIELPALLNERWLYDRDLLAAHLRHAGTGAPIPDALLQAIEAAARHDRVFSVTLDFLAAATIDLRIHQAADGGAVDAPAIERAVLAGLDVPAPIDLTMRVPHFHHAFTDVYAAGVYSYLWADVMAADVAEAFLAAPGGLYDGDVAARWRETILSAGNSVQADAAFRAFRGRDPEPAALLRRFGLA